MLFLPHFQIWRLKKDHQIRERPQNLSFGTWDPKNKGAVEQPLVEGMKRFKTDIKNCLGDQKFGVLMTLARKISVHAGSVKMYSKHLLKVK